MNKDACTRSKERQKTLIQNFMVWAIKQFSKLQAAAEHDDARCYTLYYAFYYALAGAISPAVRQWYLEINYYIIITASFLLLKAACGTYWLLFIIIEFLQGRWHSAEAASFLLLKFTCGMYWLLLIIIEFLKYRWQRAIRSK
jgi:hypothetical protein